MNTIMYRNNIIKYILTLLLGASVNVVINAQNFSTIGEIKRLTSNTHFTITFQPNTVQVAMLERNDTGNVGGTYLWDGKDGLFLFNDILPSWPINDLKVGDFVNGTLSGEWEYKYWDVYNADGEITIGTNAPLVPLQATGKDIVENGVYNKFGLYEINGVYNLDRLQFISDDGVVFSLEDIFHQLLPGISSHGTLRAMFYQGEIANYLWPYQTNAFIPDDKPFTQESNISSDVVYSIADLKKCLTSTKLEIKDGYKVQVINSLGNAYFLWDGKQGILLHDGLRKMAGMINRGSMITSGSLFCDTRAGFFGFTGSEDLVIEDNQADIAPVNKKIKDISTTDLFGYFRLFGQIEKGRYGNYVLRDGDTYIILTDHFKYGIDLEKLIGKQGYVNAVYHVVGNCFIVHPETFFVEGTDGITSTRLSEQENHKKNFYTIDGKQITDVSSIQKGIVVENGKKVIRE
ncbi:MAG: hypothetical protein SOV83_01415 [Prevotella sp.]|nr:hypothetical protein [Prevotella sp.]